MLRVALVHEQVRLPDPQRHLAKLCLSDGRAADVVELRSGACNEWRELRCSLDCGSNFGVRVCVRVRKVVEIRGRSVLHALVNRRDAFEEYAVNRSVLERTSAGRERETEGRALGIIEHALRIVGIDAPFGDERGTRHPTLVLPLRVRF